MFKLKSNSTILCSAAALSFLGSGAAYGDSLVAVTSPAAQQATDYVSWAGVGPDQTLLNASGSVTTSKGATVQIALTAANSILSRVCTSNPCSWTGAGFTAGDMLLWTSDAGN